MEIEIETLVLFLRIKYHIMWVVSVDICCLVVSP